MAKHVIAKLEYEMDCTTARIKAEKDVRDDKRALFITVAAGLGIGAYILSRLERDKRELRQISSFETWGREEIKKQKKQGEES